MKNIFLYIIYGLFFIATLNAQTWQIGWPTATDVEASLSNGTLIISGTGAMENFANTSAQQLQSPIPAATSLPGKAAMKPQLL